MIDPPSRPIDDEFLGHLVHALRTPLNAIIGFTELMYDERAGPVAPPYKEFLADILASARDLSEIIDDALELARIDAGQLRLEAEPVHVPALIADVQETLAARLTEKKLEVRIEVDPAAADAVLDPARLQQVVRSYLLSAVALSRPAGTITIGVRPQGPSEICLEVHDAGEGVAPEDLAGIFTAFGRLPGAGTPYGGAGLALARGIVEAQGGSVAVTSEPGSGTCFAAVLPRHWQPA